MSLSERARHNGFGGFLKTNHQTLKLAHFFFFVKFQSGPILSLPSIATDDWCVYTNADLQRTDYNKIVLLA